MLHLIIAPTVNKHNIYKHDNRKSTPLNDKSALNLLNKLDQGMETIVNLKSMLNVKTAEFNELIQQLTIIDQVLTSVERGAEQVELVLTDSMGTEQAKLINAEACLDSAIRSAFTLYASDNNNNSNPSINSHYSVRKEPLPIRSRSSAKYKREIILKDIEVILKYLSIDSKQYYKNINNTSNLHVLQKAYTDLNMAKTIYQSIKSNLKHRSNLIKSKNKQLYVQLIERRICEEVRLWKEYSHNSMLYINDKDTITSILNHENRIYMKNNTLASHHRKCLSINNKHSPITSSTECPLYPHMKLSSYKSTQKIHHQKSLHQKSAHHTPTQKSIQLQKSHNHQPKPIHTKSHHRLCQHSSTLQPLTMAQKEAILMIARPTSSSLAKTRQIHSNNNNNNNNNIEQCRPGSTLRLRNMLAKRTVTR